MNPALVEEYAPCALDAAAVEMTATIPVPAAVTAVEQDTAAASNAFCPGCKNDWDEAGYCSTCGEHQR